MTAISLCVKYLGTTKENRGHSVSKTIIDNKTCAPWTGQSSSYTAVTTE
jgi:hypothetical protein